MMLRELAVAAVLALSATALAQAKPAEPAKGAEKKADAGAKKDEKAGMQAPVMPPEGKKWVESNWGNWKSSDVVFNMGDKALKGIALKAEGTVEGKAAWSFTATMKK